MRLGPVLFLFACVFVFHQTQTHQNYYYLPLAVAAWLTAAGGVLASEGRRQRWCTAAWAAVLSVGMVAGLGMAGCLREPTQAAFRMLADRHAAVGGVWHMADFHFNGSGLPGYFHLGKAVPYYDRELGRQVFGEGQGRDWSLALAAVTHVISRDDEPERATRGEMARSGRGFVKVADLAGGRSLFERRGVDAPVLQWRGYVLRPDVPLYEGAVRARFPDVPWPERPASGFAGFADGPPG